MPKATSEPEKKELPRRYPRTEEILIFSDMGELDYVVGEIDKLGEALCSLITQESPVEKWLDLVNHSLVYGMMGYLRKACIEYEQFFQSDDWCSKEDQEFMKRMNDSHELHFLVNELEEGRLFETNGKICSHYEPAYHAVARSLEMAMYFREVPGGEVWIDYCIRELKFYLTRYHAASLEIAMHRKNIYLDSNAKNIEVGKRRLIQVREWGLKGGKEVEKYSKEEKIRWIDAARRIQSKNPTIKSARSLAKEIIKILGMDESSYESVRKHLSNNGLKLFGSVVS